MPFYDITVLISASSYPTSNLYFLQVWNIHKIGLIWCFQKVKQNKNDVSNRDPLLGNGHLVIFFQIQIISSGIVKCVFKSVFFWNSNKISVSIFWNAHFQIIKNTKKNMKKFSKL